MKISYDERPQYRFGSAFCFASILVFSLTGCNSSDDSSASARGGSTGDVAERPTPRPRPAEREDRVVPVEENVVPEVSVTAIGAVAPGSTVTLNAKASDSDGEITRYSWEQISGPDVSFEIDDGEDLDFVSPEEAEISAAGTETLKFEVTVWDDKNARAKAEVEVIVSNGDAPIAAAGEDFVAAQNQEIVLDAKLSEDVNGQIVSYAWRQLRGEPADDFLNTNNEQARFTAPETFRTSDMVFELTVTDNDGNVASDEISIRLLGELEEAKEDEDFFFTFINRASIKFDEVEEDGEAYYATVDPDDERTTLEDWYALNGYEIDFEDPNYEQACYINGADLGFARAMRVRVNDNGDVSGSVENYTLVDEACTAIATGEQEGLLATVTMEFTSPPNQDDGDRYTTFYVFGPDNSRIAAVDLDGRGPKAVPGLCTVCHGGQPEDVVAGIYPEDGNVKSAFLPWNLNTFTFSEDEQFSQAEQEDDLRRMNEIALLTVPGEENFVNSQTGEYTGDAMREMVEGWYGGEGLPRQTFDGGFVPAGWIPEDQGGPEGVPSDADELYLEVIEPNCVVCHLLRGTDLMEDVDLMSYDKFMAYKEEIIDYVFVQGTMPLSLLTSDLFFAVEPDPDNDKLGGDGIVADVTRLAALVGFDPTGRIDDGLGNLPGKAVAEATGPSVAPLREPIQLSGTGSTFEDFYDWEIIAAPAGSNATLIGAESDAPLLDADIEGEYEIRLIVANEDGLSEPTTVKIFAQNNLDPVSFSEEVFPLLLTTCAASCHNPNGIQNIPVEFDNEGSARLEALEYINFDDITNSPILRKPSGNFHGGNTVNGFDLNGNRSGYDLLHRWILEGAEAN